MTKKQPLSGFPESGLLMYDTDLNLDDLKCFKY